MFVGISVITKHQQDFEPGFVLDDVLVSVSLFLGRRENNVDLLSKVNKYISQKCPAIVYRFNLVLRFYCHQTVRMLQSSV